MKWVVVTGQIYFVIVLAHFGQLGTFAVFGIVLVKNNPYVVMLNGNILISE
jgi:hypothetical protein